MGNFVSQSLVIKNETVAGANTANRVGSVLEGISKDSLHVNSLSDMKALDASEGDFARISYHTTSSDYGGGLFRLTRQRDIQHRNVTFGISVGGSFNFIPASSTTIGFRSGDRIQMENGSILEVTSDQDTGDTSIPVNVISGSQMLSNDYGYVIPKFEGIKAVPTGNVPSGTLWKRMNVSNTAKLEWFGIQGHSLNTEFNNSITDVFNYLTSHGMSIQLEATKYYTSGTLNIDRTVSVFGQGGPVPEYNSGLFLVAGSDQPGTIIFTENDINIMRIQAAYVQLMNFSFDGTQINPTNNGSTYHTKYCIEYDLSYRCDHGLTMGISALGDYDGMITSGSGTNFIRYNRDDAIVTKGAGSAYFMTHTNMTAKYLDTVVKIDGVNQSQLTDVAACRYDIDILKCKQGYKMLDTGTPTWITGTYFQDGAVLPFEERNRPVAYIRGGKVIWDLPIGDSAYGVDNATSEASSSYTYPRAHVHGQLLDFGTIGVVYKNATMRNFPEDVVDGNYYPGTEGRDLSYDPAVFLHSKMGKTQEISGLDNYLRDADIIHTVRTGLLDGSGITFSSTTSEQIGVLSGSLGASWYLSTNDTVFRYRGGRPTSIFSSTTYSTDFAEIVVEESLGMKISNLYLNCQYFDQVQCIFYYGDTTGTSGIDSTLKNTSQLFTKFTPTATVYKLILRFIGPNDSYAHIHDIFATTDAISVSRPSPFIGRGDAPVMQGADGNWYKLDTPPNGGGTATWVSY